MLVRRAGSLHIKPSGLAYFKKPNGTNHLNTCSQYSGILAHQSSKKKFQNCCPLQRLYTHQFSPVSLKITICNHYPPPSLVVPITVSLILTVTLKLLVSSPLPDKFHLAYFQSLINTLAPQSILAYTDTVKGNKERSVVHILVSSQICYLTYTPNPLSFLQKLLPIFNVFTTFCQNGFLPASLYLH